MPRTAAALLLLLAGLLLAPAPAQGHEIPADVTALVFLRASDGRVQLLVRVPLTSMRDIDFPLRGAGYLILDETTPLLPDLARLWIADYLEIRADHATLDAPRILAARISLPSDRSFATFDRALAHLSAPPLDPSLDLVPEQALLDVLLEYGPAAPGARIAILPELGHLGLRTAILLRFVTEAGVERALQFDGDPGLVRLDPRWHQAAWTFVRLGFLHILGGLDHILFVLCLVIPFRRFGPLVPVVTAFTVAHSITLAASALDFTSGGLWFTPLVETLIAVSILWMALENIAGFRPHRRWAVAFAFGLVHGFGFSFLLRDSLQFAGGHLASSLLAFNVGVELGQLFILLLAIPLLELLFRRGVPERIGVGILSALIAHTAWHWMTERGEELLQYRVAPPVLDALFLAAALRWLMLALVVGGVLALMSAGVRRWSRRFPPAAEGRGTG